MALIERVDTTMYAPRGPCRILLALGCVAACQTRITPEECADRATALTRWMSTIDQSAPLIPDLPGLPERDLPDRPTPGTPIVVLSAKRIVFANEPIADDTELAYRLGRYILAQNGKRPPIGLAISGEIPWRRVVATFELVERTGFEQIELYYVAPVVRPPAPEQPLDVGDCPAVAEVLADPKTLAVRIDPALRACGCRVDQDALRATVWTALANPHPIRVVRIAPDRAGAMNVHPSDMRWSEVAMRSGAGWLVAR